MGKQSTPELIGNIGTRKNQTDTGGAVPPDPREAARPYLTSKLQEVAANLGQGQIQLFDAESSLENLTKDIENLMLQRDALESQVKAMKHALKMEKVKSDFITECLGAGVLQ